MKATNTDLSIIEYLKASTAKCFKHVKRYANIKWRAELGTNPQTDTTDPGDTMFSGR